MNSGNVDVQPRFVNTLWTQAKTANTQPPNAMLCPYCTNNGRMFLTLDQLFDHAKDEHSSILQAMDPSQARATVKDAALLKL